MSSQLLISEIAELLGLTPKALRYYEKLSLIIPGRSENGYRVYTADHVLRLLRIQRLRSLGLSLTQIKTVLDEKSDAQVWQIILHALLDKVDGQIGALEQRREELERLIADGGSDILALPEELNATMKRAQEYLDHHLDGAQASLWAMGTHFLLSQWLAEPPLQTIRSYHSPVHTFSPRS